MKNLIPGRALFILIISLFFLAIPSKAQVQTPHFYTSITTNSNGYYDYLPQGYNPTGSETFPLLIYIHGMGESGNGSPAELPRLLNAGPPAMIHWGTFPTSFTVNGQTHRFIVLTPQFINWPQYADIDNLINYAINHYKVNINRIYLTGISMGGGVIWDYAGWYVQSATRIAAMVPVCGANYPWNPYGQNIAAANLPVWATHNVNDPVVGVQLTYDNVNNVNNGPVVPSVLAKQTIFNATGHDAWTQTYNLNFRENGLNVFEWMLQYQRNLVVLPVSSIDFSVTGSGENVLLEWETQNEQNSRGFEIQRSPDGIHYSPVTFINSLASNGNNGSYRYLDVQPFNGKNFYRLKQVDNDNSSRLSEVRSIELKKSFTLSVYPNPVTDRLTLKSNGYVFGRAQIRITDVLGKTVKQQWLTNTNQATLIVDDLAPGVYAGEIIEGTITRRFRFIRK